MVQDALFNTVPKQDYLSFFPHHRLQPKGVVDFLDFRRDDVARAAGVVSASVRYDEKMPHELSERFTEWANLLNLVAGHFEGDAQKTASWFRMPNPLLGNVSPRDMIRLGRYKKLLKFILIALAENNRP